VALVIGLTVGAGFLVATTLRAPDVPSYAPTVPAPEEVGARKVGPAVVTVDASDGDEWIYFDFSRGSVVESPTPKEWDLAFQRHRIIVNGGPGFAGEGGVRPLPSTHLDSVDTVPDAAYVVNERERDSANPALERWYDYSWTSHVLDPKPVVYAVRTADGRFAKLQILGYYCPGARPGCLTLRYVYQGDGGVDVRAP
jgi:hypothetical protein